MRTVSVIFYLLVAVGLGCSRRSGPVTIKVAARSHPFLARHKDRLAADFKKHYKKDLQFILLDARIYENDLLRLLSGKDEDIPDIAEMDQPLKFKYLHAVEPLNPWVRSWDLPLTDEDLKDFVNLRTDPQGNILGICRHYPEPYVILLRADWLAGTDHTFPTTIEEMLAIVRYFSSRPFRQRLGSEAYAWAWEPRLPHLVLRAYNNALVEYNEKTGRYVPGFTSNMGKAELNSLVDMYKRGALPPNLFEPGEGSMSGLFKQGRLGMLLTPLSRGLALTRQMASGQVVLGGLPRGSVKPANGLTSAWCMVSLGRQQEAAWDFYQWWFSPSTFELLCSGPGPADSTGAGTSYFSPLLSLFDAHAREAEQRDPLNRKIYDIISHEKMQFSEHPYLREIEDIVRDYYWYALTGSLSIDQALEGAVIKINKMHLLN